MRAAIAALVAILCGCGEPPPDLQAGAKLYAQHCGACHGMKLEGQGGVPPLAGRDFRWDWDLMGIDSLFEKMLYTMPVDKQSNTNPIQEADILAYILQYNQYPAGSRDLPADADLLRVVRFEADKSLH